MADEILDALLGFALGIVIMGIIMCSLHSQIVIWNIKGNQIQVEQRIRVSKGNKMHYLYDDGTKLQSKEPTSFLKEKK